MTRIIDGTRIAAKYVEQAISDEWFAHFQYWIGSVIVGDEWEDVVSQFAEHSKDEYDHATELAQWLRKVPREGYLPYAMSELQKNQHCGYIFPSGNTPEALVSDGVEGERCAVEFYERFLGDMSDKEFYGSDLRGILERILEKEKEHLRDLETLLKYGFRYSFFLHTKYKYD